MFVDFLHVGYPDSDEMLIACVMFSDNKITDPTDSSITKVYFSQEEMNLIASQQKNKQEDFAKNLAKSKLGEA